MTAKALLSPARIVPAIDAHATAPWIRIGNLVCAGLGVLLAVFAFVSISGAVVSPGVVNVESNYKTVQHLDGGIVARILVKNGDRVAEGDVVVQLDPTAARANLAVAVARMNEFLVQQARLEAERDRKPKIELPAPVRSAMTDPTLARAITAQQAMFDTRMSSRNGELDVLRQKLEQAGNDAAGVEKILAARRKEAALNAEELAAVKPLFDRGFANQQRLMPIQREQARLEGEIGRLTSELSKVKGVVAEAQLKLQQSDKEFMQQVADELRKVQASLAEVVEQRTALEDKLKRIDVRAPKAGRIHALAVHTEGGVIQPASPILQIIPEGERLIVDAQLPPTEIDKVRKGQPAYIRFTAFNARSTPRLDGAVINISAAQITDNQGRSFFTVQIALADGELAKIPTGHALVPGMPAEVYIETGSRTILSYFLKPLTDAMSRSFRES
ncbi:MAG: HlyD family type I secretion periplasmic adaptor subunit [Hyphomicrobiaceae bacterium]